MVSGSVPSPGLFKALVGSAVVVASILGLVFACPSSAQTKRIYLANDDHTDYFWTGDDVQYRAAFLSMLDYYMAQAEATASKPPDSRGRFNTDGTIWVWEYERNKPASQFQRLMNHVRAGNVTVPLNNAVLCYGAMPAEAVLRSMYYAGRLERRENLRLPLVLAMENQTLPGGLASLWAGSGAKYSWRGVCGCATRTDYGNRPREIYHYAGPDGRSVCMKWNTKASGVTMVVGSYDEVRHPTPTVRFLDQDPGFLARWPWPVSAAFGYGGDDLETKTDSLILVSERLSTPERRVIVSNEVDFFEDFLAHHGHEIPTFSGSFGNEWDLYSASMGAVTARFKASIEKLRTAEALATVASLVDPGILTGREAARDRAFMAAGLYYEHDWTADGPMPRERRAQFQRDMLRDLETYVDALHADALAAVAARVAHPGGAERHLVFNPLSWTRIDFADLTVALPAPRHVVDVATGAAVPSQALPGGRVRILARDVPSVGYRIYEVRSGAGPSFPASAAVQLPGADNGIYAVQLGSRGHITSLIDRRDGDRQLVPAGGALHDLGSGNGSVTVESSGPVSTTLRVSAGGSPAHETRVTLYAGIDRVDVEGRITENFSSNVGYASRFALPGAVMRHEEVGMIARVARAAQGGDYADQNARTDWLTFNHFVDLSLASRGVTVSNWDSPFFRAGASTTTFLDATTPAIEAVVGMQVDGGTFGIPNQGGDSQFLNRFALRAHGAYDPAEAMRFALEHQNPLVAARLTGGASAPLTAPTWSLLSLPSPDVLLWALKPAEDGVDQGWIARVWNLSDQPRTAALALPATGIAQARATTHLETDLGAVSLVAGAVPLDLERQQMSTFRVVPRSLTATDSVPPVFVSGPGVAAGSDTARVTWEADRPVIGVVDFGTTSELGRSVAAPASAVRHSVRLTGLAPGTLHHYRVAITDAAGNTTMSPVATFTTTTLINLPPVARAAATPAGGLAPLTVAFSSAGSVDPEGGSLSWHWAFGDGQTSTAAHPTHVYAAGRYDAVLTVTDAGGASATATVGIVAGAPPPFPATAVLDDFNRPDGALGSPWIDQVAGMSIRSQQLAQTTSNVWSTPVWGGSVFGPDQEAYVTLRTITTTAPEHDLLLKVQGGSHLNGTIEVRYDATVRQIFVATYTPSGGWTTHGAVTVTLSDGDRLGARAFANGGVDVYRNGTKLLTTSVASWPFAAQGGRIGLTIARATDSRLDDFGGGDIGPGAIGPDVTPPAFVVAPIVAAARDSAVVRWTASEPARGVVRFGKTAALGDSVEAPPAASPTVTLPRLERGTSYSYQVAILDASGNAAVSPLATFITLPDGPPADEDPPAFLSGPTVTVGRDSANVRWTTSEPATGVVRFRLPAGAWQAVATPRDTAHAATLAALVRSAVYEYEVAVLDTAGNDTVSAVATFTTLANRPPVAVATASPVSGPPPFVVRFSSAGSIDPDGDPLTYLWRFGDGATSNVAHPTHAYAGGTFMAILQVADTLGASDTASVSITTPSGWPPFPSSGGVDDFNRSSGTLRGWWVDQTSGLTINANRLAPTTTSSRSTVWDGAVFGKDQEAYVRLLAFNANPTHLDLMLKVQGTTWSSGHIQVRYDQRSRQVSVSTYHAGVWTPAGPAVAVAFVPGDQLGARAWSSGSVNVYRNGVKLGTWSVASWPYAARGGRIGLTLAGSTATRLDDFGGGNVGSGAPPAALAEREAEASAMTEPETEPALDPPRALQLSEAVPNPSRGSVAFELELPQPSTVDVVVVDVRGRALWRDRVERAAGRWTLTWEGHDRQGGRMPPGIYFLRVRAGTASFVRRFVRF